MASLALPGSAIAIALMYVYIICERQHHHATSFFI